MPFYRYQCTSCTYAFDDLAAMDSPPPACPNMVMRPTEVEGEYEHVPCGKQMVRVPQAVSGRVQGGTPKFHRGGPR